LLNNLIKNFEVYTSLNVLEEAVFKVTVESLRETCGDMNFYKIKSKI